MSEPTRDEKCKVIAEWLGWTGIRRLPSDGARWVEDGLLWGWPPGENTILSILPDFYRSEEASALALEKMANPQLRKWEASGNSPAH